MLKEFRKFILRGNVVDLAVGIAVGAAFTSVVNSLVNDMITPIITAVGGKQQFSDATFSVHGGVFHYGSFINAVVSFVIVAGAVFFFVVQPINKLTELTQKGKTTDDPTTKKCPECLSEIPKDASRCKFCTAKLSK